MVNNNLNIQKSGTYSGIFSPKVQGFTSREFSILNRSYFPKNKCKSINSYSVSEFLKLSLLDSYSGLKLQELELNGIDIELRSSNNILIDQILKDTYEYFITIEVFIKNIVIRLQEYYQRFYA